MASRLASQTNAPTRHGRSPFTADRLPDDMLRPMLFGAQARGMADAFEMLGLCVVFLGADGHVLFVNDRARAMMGTGVDLVADHLVASGPSDNEALSHLIVGALTSVGTAEDRGNAPVILKQRGHPGTLTIRALPLPPGASISGQLVRVVLLLDSGEDPRVPAFLTRMTDPTHRCTAQCGAG